MDLDQESGAGDEDPDAVRASDQGGGPLGFAGAAARSGLAQPTGLATLIAVTAAAAPPAAAAPSTDTTIGASTTAIWMAACMKGQKIISV
ncbi:hypothetical protein [Mycobacterium sp. E1715]|uniref:PPW family C-terminal domain-containing PPE protein n=1 Tax=Mycobacterium sp. E1715 TaxID=1856863 RepID=UPI0035173258